MLPCDVAHNPSCLWHLSCMLRLSGYRAGAASGLTAQVDEVALTSALPLAPGASVTVPLYLHPAQASLTLLVWSAMALS